MSWRQLRKHHILWITNIILRSNPDDFDEEDRKMFLDVVETINRKKER